MPPKKVPTAKDERGKRVRSVAKQLNEQELVHELNQVISNQDRLPAERSRSPSISDGMSRSPSPTSVISPRLKVKRRRIQSPTNSPYSSRSSTPINSSPRVPSPAPETAPTAHHDPKPTSRARRYGLRLTSISEREIPPRRVVPNQRKASEKLTAVSGGVGNEIKRAGQIATIPRRQVPKDDRSHRSIPHGQQKQDDARPMPVPQSTPGTSKSYNEKRALKEPSLSAPGLDKAQQDGKGRKRHGRDASGQVNDEQVRKRTSQGTSGLHPQRTEVATVREELDDHDVLVQVSPDHRVSRRSTKSASGSVNHDKSRKRHDRGSLGQGSPEALVLVNDDIDFSHHESSTSPVSASVDSSAKLQADNRRLKELVKRLENKISAIEKEKVDAVNHALKLSIELQELREGKEGGEGLEFTEVEDVPVTKEDMEELSARSSTDSMFVGLLLTLIIGSERLSKMSTTGQPSRRYAKKKNSDGSLAYPATEAVKQYIIDFLCDKVAQRNQMLLGYRNITKIRHASTEKKIKGYITTKIGNLKKAEHERRRVEANPH